MTCYSVEPRTRKYVTGYGFLSFARNLSNKSEKQVYCYKKRNKSSKKIIHKAAEATVEFLGNKIADMVTKWYGDKTVKTKPVIDENSRNVEEVIIPPEKREEMLNEFRQVLEKWNTMKYLSY